MCTYSKAMLIQRYTMTPNDNGKNVHAHATYAS
jgi:hypothetical protein